MRQHKIRKIKEYQKTNLTRRASILQHCHQTCQANHQHQRPNYCQLNQVAFIQDRYQHHINHLCNLAASPQHFTEGSGKQGKINKLVTGPDGPTWTCSLAKKFGRLCTGIGKNAKGRPYRRHRHKVFHNKRQDPQRQKNPLRKLNLQHTPEKIRDTSLTPNSRRRKTRLSWRPKFPSSLPPQRENPYQQHHLTRKKQRKIHVNRHQELLSGNSHEVFPIHAHLQKNYSSRGTRQI